MSRRRAQFALPLDGGKPRARAVPGDTRRETDIQRDVLRLLQLHPSVALAHRINTRVLDVADAKAKRGTRPLRTAPTGHPDIAGMLRDGRALYVECKSARGALSEAQERFLDQVRAGGGVAIVARSIDDVLAALPMPSANSWRDVL
jgi:hypothetical protein